METTAPAGSLFQTECSNFYFFDDIGMEITIGDDNETDTNSTNVEIPYMVSEEESESPITVSVVTIEDDSNEVIEEGDNNNPITKNGFHFSASSGSSDVALPKKEGAKNKRLEDLRRRYKRSCPHCKYIARSVMNLRRHMREKHERYRCPYCFYCTVNPNCLTTHKILYHSWSEQDVINNSASTIQSSNE